MSTWEIDIYEKESNKDVFATFSKPHMPLNPDFVNSKIITFVYNFMRTRKVPNLII